MDTKYQRITAMEAREMMRKHPSAVVLDVRTPEEFATGKIPGAFLLPLYTVRERAARAFPDKNTLILIYCRSGVRSRDAAHILLSMGYRNVYDFGGLNAWPYDREV